MPERYYGFAVGRIRVLETRLLDRAKLERLAEAADLAEALAQLGETEYGPLVAAGLAPTEIAAAELARVRDLVLRLAEGAPEVDFLLWRWDLQNLKVLLRGEVDRVGLNRLGRYRPEEISTWFAKNDPALPAFFAEARRSGQEVLARTGDPQMMDAVLDRLYYDYGSKFWPGRSELLAAYWTARIDLFNLKSFVRAKKLGLAPERLRQLLLPGGRVAVEVFLAHLADGWDEVAAWWVNTPYSAILAAGGDPADLPALERAVDNFLLERIKPAKAVPLGLEPVLGYYLAKEHETRLVNLILAAKAARVSPARLKERLRHVYA
ncbi:MAG: V-type ATPase subunit [Bacillota bacterium]